MTPNQQFVSISSAPIGPQKCWVWPRVGRLFDLLKDFTISDGPAGLNARLVSVTAKQEDQGAQ